MVGKLVIIINDDPSRAIRVAGKIRTAGYEPFVVEKPPGQTWVETAIAVLEEKFEIGSDKPGAVVLDMSFRGEGPYAGGEILRWMRRKKYHQPVFLDTRYSGDELATVLPRTLGYEWFPEGGWVDELKYALNSAQPFSDEQSQIASQYAKQMPEIPKESREETLEHWFSEVNDAARELQADNQPADLVDNLQRAFEAFEEFSLRYFPAFTSVASFRQVRSAIQTLPLLTMEERAGKLEILVRTLGDLQKQMKEAPDLQNAHDTVHSMEGKKAACRILFGAYFSGDLPEKEFEATLQEIDAAELYEESFNETIEEQPPAKTKFSHSERRIISARAIARANDISANGTLAKHGTFIFIDDEYKEQGWDAVLGCVLRNRGFELECFAEPVPALERMTELETEPEPWEALAGVLLDIQWPKDLERGLDILKMFKKEHYDVPVIMVTAAERISTAKKALRLGASDYFVKERDDPARDYVGYYNSLMNMIEAITSTKIKPQRKLWHRINQIEYLPNLKALSIFPIIIGHLRKAYFYYTRDADAPDMQYILLPLERESFKGKALGEEPTIYTEAIAHCGSVVEKIVIDEIENASTLKRLGCRDVNQAMRELGCTKIIEKLHWRDSLKTDGRNLYRWRNYAIHYNIGSKSRAGNAFATVLKFLKEYGEELGLPPNTVMGRAFAQIDFTVREASDE